jgi:hypothetical protein
VLGMRQQVSSHVSVIHAQGAHTIQLSCQLCRCFTIHVQACLLTGSIPVHQQTLQEQWLVLHSLPKRVETLPKCAERFITVCCAGKPESAPRKRKVQKAGRDYAHAEACQVGPIGHRPNQLVGLSQKGFLRPWVYGRLNV